jgi:hypothetical protein
MLKRDDGGFLDTRSVVVTPLLFVHLQRDMSTT